MKLGPQVARRLVAGDVRFGRQNGFRMPPEWERWVVIFGRDILNEIPTADLSDFGVEGGLRYVGSMEFLEQRLAVPMNEFLARADVQCVMQPDIASPEGAEFDESEPLDELERDPKFNHAFEEFSNTIDAGAARLADRAREWCASHGAEPIPMLDDAARIVFTCLIPTLHLKQSGREPTDGELEQAEGLAYVMRSQRPPAERKVLNASVERLRDWMDEVAGAIPDAEPASAPPPQSDSANG